MEVAVGNWGLRRHVLVACLLGFGQASLAGISEDRVLILVNGASSSSQFAANSYRQCHPGVPEENVVCLTGLPDIATTADEIITRDDYETYIAQPVRQYLLDHDLVDHIWVIITTTGMPYRIADSCDPNVVYPHGSYEPTVSANVSTIDAAAVESELVVLWQTDPALDPNHRAPLEARIVNPYHGYISPMESFCGDRDILARRTTFNFQKPLFDETHVYEGQTFNFLRATGGRQFCVKDMYLVARLDGPRTTTTPPDYYIGRMIEMAERVSDPSCSKFHGYDPLWTGVVIDDKSCNEDVTDCDFWLNAGSAIGATTPPEQYLTAATYPTPPNVLSRGIYRDDFRYAFRSLTGDANLPDPDGEMSLVWMGLGMIGGPVLYDPTDYLVSKEVDPNFGLGGLCCFGIHQRAASPPADYLLTGGPGGSYLFEPVYGAIFSAFESFGATTFFADADIPSYAQQGKLWQWIYIGGSGGLGAAFEPLGRSIPDNDLLFYNYFRDADDDGVGDMTFVEAAYSAIPDVSWAIVVVGDPLMRINRRCGVGPGWWVPGLCGSGIAEGLLATGLALGGFGLVQWWVHWRRRR